MRSFTFPDKNLSIILYDAMILGDMPSWWDDIPLGNIIYPYVVRYRLFVSAEMADGQQWKACLTKDWRYDKQIMSPPTKEEIDSHISTMSTEQFLQLLGPSNVDSRNWKVEPYGSEQRRYFMGMGFDVDEEYCLEDCLEDLEHGIIMRGRCGHGNDDVRYRLSDAGVLTISGNGAVDAAGIDDENSCDFDQHEGNIYCFYSIFSFTDITKVVIEEGITEIREWSFRKCSAHTVVLPESINQICSCAFEECISLRSVILPQKEDIKISEFAFGYISYYDGKMTGCPSLSEESINAINRYRPARTHIDGLLYVFYHDTKTAEVEDIDFNGQSEVVIPNSVTYEGKEYTVTIFSAFIPKKVTEISLPASLNWFDEDSCVYDSIKTVEKITIGDVPLYCDNTLCNREKFKDIVNIDILIANLEYKIKHELSSLFY